MENEPLLPYSSPRKWSPLLCPLREDDEVASPRNSPMSHPGPKDSWPRRSKLHRFKTAPAMAVISDTMYHPTNMPQVGSQTIVRQAVILLCLYLAFGVFIYWSNRDSFNVTETHPVVDALYFCIVTMCTIGYGDITPNSTLTKMFSILFVLVGFGFVDVLLTRMISYVLDLQENCLLRNVKRRGGRKKESNAGSCIIDVKKGRVRIRMKVALALGVVVLCIGIGAGVLHFVEKLGWLDSFYLSVMSVTTVGYGDRGIHVVAWPSFCFRLVACVYACSRKGVLVLG